MDVAGLFAEVVASRSYATFEEFKTAFSAFQEATGFVYVKDNTNRFKENRPERSTIIYRNIVFCCSFYGGRGIRKKSGSMCPSRIKVSGAGGVLTVSDWNMDHNHTVQPKNLMEDDLDAEGFEDVDYALAVPSSGAIHDLWSGDSDAIVYRRSPGYEFDYQDTSPPNISAASHLCKESVFYDDPI
ncbi:unnamed protein product [Dibothriocephalus latus]|uniref:ZSWIM3 N-terminal domain-containing protein n=1 Tax=Dibothriocephalus latus TaxID=60516 RepID=A0A3P7NXF2_DIBLA|nr:unnamed protein product [Dibothriocephalus latus]